MSLCLLRTHCCRATRFTRSVTRFRRHRATLLTSRLCTVAAPIASPPPPDGTKVYPEKLYNIVEEISELTLKETAQLNELLKEKLNISDVPMMAASASATLPEGGSSEKEKADEQTEFTVKLVKYSEDSKVKLIKKVKGLMPSLNLIQAKKLIESLPQVLKEDISKDEAEKLKAEVEAEGGQVVIE